MVQKLSPLAITYSVPPTAGAGKAGLGIDGAGATGKGTAGVVGKGTGGTAALPSAGKGGNAEPASGRAGKFDNGFGVTGSGKVAGSGCRFTIPAISCSVSF